MSAREEDRGADALPNFAYRSFLRASIWSAQLCLSASSASTSVRILSSCAWRCSSASEAGRCTKVVSSLYLLRVERRERGEGGRRGGKRRGGAGRRGGGGEGDGQLVARSRIPPSVACSSAGESARASSRGRREREGRDGHDLVVVVDELELGLDLFQVLALLDEGVEDVDDLVCAAVEPGEGVDAVLVLAGDLGVGRRVVLVELRGGRGVRWGRL